MRRHNRGVKQVTSKKKRKKSWFISIDDGHLEMRHELLISPKHDHDSIYNKIRKSFGSPNYGWETRDSDCNARIARERSQTIMAWVKINRDCEARKARLARERAQMKMAI